MFSLHLSTSKLFSLFKFPLSRTNEQTNKTKKLLRKNPIDLRNIRQKMSIYDSIGFYLVVGKISICLMNGFTMRWSFFTLLRLSNRTNAISIAIDFISSGTERDTISQSFFFSKHFQWFQYELRYFRFLINAKNQSIDQKWHF